METEIIKPWVEKYKDNRGVPVTTVGVDTVNHRVIFRRPDYPYDCMLPRVLFSQKFRKVSP
ncbi:MULTISPECIES: DUF4222 domain-containing protein [Pantoea]|uniref:DUF4222 domain-containing protein n=1 Tax=Pantoea TaxID=53335 RepID=UPI001FF6CE9C|nr:MULTISPECIES: DUF4222 domain-containing protein [Pantoea]MCK0554339.1 DUF4222 domain-containing protein [Pantoea ananatis]MCS3405406.1 DUF4222 domain-containing protein [Pantoea sp. B566]